jgi:hypothetical protein
VGCCSRECYPKLVGTLVVPASRFYVLCTDTKTG